MYRRINSRIQEDPQYAEDVLSLLAFLAFPHLHLIVDNHGRGNADPRWVAAKLQLLRRDIDPGEVSRWMDEYEEAGLIRRWEAGHRSVFEIVSFDEDQADTARNRGDKSKSEYPDPPGQQDESAPHASPPVPHASPPVPHRYPTGTPPVPHASIPLARDGRDRTPELRTQNSPPSPPQGPREVVSPSARGDVDEGLSAVTLAFQRWRGIAVRASDWEALTTWQREFPEDWILRAIEEAIARNGRSCSYVFTTLTRWRKSGGPDAVSAPEQPPESTKGERPSSADLTARRLERERARERDAQSREEAITAYLGRASPAEQAECEAVARSRLNGVENPPAFMLRGLVRAVAAERMDAAGVGA